MPDNTQLAQSAAATVVAAAGTDLWVTASNGFAKLLSGGDRQRHALAMQRLNDLAADLLEARPDNGILIRQMSVIAWQTRLADMLQESPELAASLEELTSQLAASLPSAGQTSIQNVTATAGGSAYGVIQGNQYIHHHRGAPGPLATEGDQSK